MMDKTLDKVTGLLDTKYSRIRTDKVEEAVEDLLKFREDEFEDDNDLILARDNSIKDNWS